MIVHLGDLIECQICQQPHAAGETLSRLQCRHNFHAACIVGYIEHIERQNRRSPVFIPDGTSHACCPICRCTATIVATYINPNPTVTTERDSSGIEVPNLITTEQGTSPRSPLTVESGTSPRIPSASDPSVRYVMVDEVSPDRSFSIGLSSEVTPPLTPRTQSFQDVTNTYGIAEELTQAPPAPPSPPPVTFTGGSSAVSFHEFHQPFPGSPEVQLPLHHHSDSEGTSQLDFVIMPETFQDAADWVRMSPGSCRLDAPATCFLDGPTGNCSRWEDMPDPHASFHTETRPRGKVKGALVDPGSIGNLGGDAWSRELGIDAQANGRNIDHKPRDRPLNVSGVGNGSQSCTHNAILPIALEQMNGQCSGGTFELPVVPNSQIPGLIGLASLIDKRGLLDMVNKRLYFLGEGDFDLPAALPPGTECYQLETAPSGHLILPMNNYEKLDSQQAHGKLQLDKTTHSLLVDTVEVDSSSEPEGKRSRSSK